MERADIRVYLGATGTGKSHEVKRALAELQPPRLLILDPGNEYAELAELATLRQLHEATTLPAFALRVAPPLDPDQARAVFDLFCRIAIDLSFRRGLPCVVVVDELPKFVYADDGQTSINWRSLVQEGRKHGVTILTTGQRPALINKGTLDNASLIRTGRLNNRASITAAADALDVPADDIRALVDREWIERDRNTGELRRSNPPKPAAAPSTKPPRKARKSRPIEPRVTKARRKA